MPLPVIEMKVVAAAIIKKKDTILIAQRAKDDKLSCQWEFPGGKLEPGETPEECLIREIKEELNLDIEIKAYFATSFYTYDTGEIKLMAYIAGIACGELQLNVHQDARWVKVSELSAYDFCPADLELVDRIALAGCL